MTQYGMGDDATIDEVINDVDTDNVRKYLLLVVLFRCRIRVYIMNMMDVL